MKKIGFKLKPSMDQRPASPLLIQGVIMTFEASSFTVSTDTGRMQRFTAQVHERPKKGTMSPDEATSLAKKSQFISEAMRSETIHCCTQPLHAPDSTPLRNAQIPLGSGITDAWQTLLRILPSRGMRVFNLRETPCTIVYAEARFQAGDQKLSVRTELDQPGWHEEIPHLLKNGWGFVTRRPTTSATMHMERPRTSSGGAVHHEEGLHLRPGNHHPDDSHGGENATYGPDKHLLQ